MVAKHLCAALLCALSLTSLAACSSGAPAATTPKEASPAAWHTSPAQEATTMTTWTLPARLVLTAARRGELNSPVQGQLVRWVVEPGQRIEPGQLVALVRSESLTALINARSRAETTLQAQARVVDAKQAQRQAGVGTQAELTQAELELSLARAERVAAQQHLESLKSLGVTYEGKGLWGWRSAAAGQLAAPSCSPGAQLSVGLSCAQILDSSALEARVMLPQRGLAALGDQPSASWRSHLMDEPERELKLTRRDAQLDPETMALALYWSAPQGFGPAALAQQTGTLKLQTKAPQGAVRLPRAALTLIDARHHIFIMRGDTPEPLAVELLSDEGETVIVRHPELVAGAAVVDRQVFTLKSQRLLAQE